MATMSRITEAWNQGSTPIGPGLNCVILQRISRSIRSPAARGKAASFDVSTRSVWGTSNALPVESIMKKNRSSLPVANQTAGATKIAMRPGPHDTNPLDEDLAAGGVGT